MKIVLKQKILDLMDSLLEATDYIQNNLANDYSFITQVCLEAIDVIENNLRDCKIIDNSIITICSELKEKFILLYKNTESLDFDICNVISNCIYRAKQLIHEQNDEKIDIVFLPYNAAMWNSLESIWKAASKDPMCNCYVMPIPYYKIKMLEDGSEEGIFCYEGDKFPEYVPVINYKKLDLQELKPDIIYVHNQYDNYNTATQVDSKYFSSSLKKCTNMLVYVPYAILGTYPISFYNDFYSFIQTRGFDRVVVQAPVFQMIAEKSGIDSNKILTLGSPKMDGLITSIETQEVSRELEDKFKNRTVFLWTTNLMKIVNSKDKALDEIEEVFNIIKKHSKCGLIFRPHPLERVYVQSMVPECFIRYEEILNSVEGIENIMIDYSSNYYEVFTISDALITDRSSVLIEYMATGKPVLIYDIELEKEYYSEDVFDIFANDIVGQNNMTVEYFINKVVNKEDNNKQRRLDALNTVITNRDGSCGEKVHKRIKEDILGITYYNE